MPSRFQSASAETKAAIVAGVCGVFAVFSGFALYLVFENALEEGDAVAKLAGIAVGAVLAMAVAAFGHRLWEAIDDGELSFARPAAKTVIATLSLLIVFEFSASAFEDLARATLGDFDSIRRIAGEIAGRNDSKEDDATLAEAALLLPILQDAASRLPHDCPSCVKTPEARLIAMLPDEVRYDIFAPELKPSDDELKAVYFKGIAYPGQRPCRTVAFGDEMLHPDAHVTPATDADLVACRAQLEGYSQSARVESLRTWLNLLLADHNLYDAESFRLTASGTPLEIGRKLATRLKAQRAACDEIVRKIATPAQLNCFARLQNALGYDAPFSQARFDLAAPFRQTLVSPRTIRLWNRELLSAAFPKAIERPAMNWLDLALLFIVWCATGAFVGVSLSWLATETDKKPLEAVGSRLFDAGVTLIIAGSIAGVLLVAVRVVFSIFTLATYPAQTTTADGNTTRQVLIWLNDTLWLPPYVVMIGALAALVYGKRWWLRLAGGAALAGLVYINLPDTDGIGNVMTLIEMAWIVPTVGLALLAPYLRPGARFPWAWGIAALLLAAAIAVWEASTFGASAPWRGAFVFGGLALIALALWFFSRVSLVDLTPIWAVMVALFLVGGTAVFQDATFNGALRELHPAMATGGQGGNWYSQIEDAADSYVAAESDDDVDESFALQLWLSGAVGFWLTVALLLTWSLKAGPHPHAIGAEEQKR